MTLSELNSEGLGRFISLEKYGLTTRTLKIIAVVTMFIDHFAIMFCGNYQTLYRVLRSIGRLSFPIFCFVLVEGFFHTSNRRSYAIRLGIFALISEVPYDMLYGNFIYLGSQNVMFTLFFGFFTIWGLDFVSMYRVKYPEGLLKHIGASRLNTILEVVIILFGALATYFINSAYSYAGVMLILCFYVFRKQHIGKLISNFVFNWGMFGFGIQWWGVVSAIPIALYNGNPGSKRGKYFFYIFYPAHLVLLVLIKHFIF